MLIPFHETFLLLECSLIKGDAGRRRLCELKIVLFQTQTIVRHHLPLILTITNE